MADSKPLRNSAIKAYDLDDEIMLYGPGGELVYSLNSSAKSIWSLCDGTRTVAQICKELAGALGVEPGELMADIETAIQSFADSDLLVTPEP